MVRSVIAVIVSYIVMFVLTFIAFVCAYLVVGAEVAFKPASYEASTTWIGIAFAINVIIAIIGGVICAVIAKGGRAPLALAVLVLVLGLLFALPARSKREANLTATRAGNVSSTEAAQKAYWPVWVPFTFPLTGAIGVLIGGRLKKRS